MLTATTLKQPQSFYSSTLTANISASATTIPVATPPTKTSGYLVIEADSSNRELILYAGVSGNNLTGCVRGLAETGASEGAGTGKPHGSGLTISMNVSHYYVSMLQAAFNAHEILPEHSYRGSVASVANLSGITNPDNGDLALTRDTNVLYRYNSSGATWDALAAPVSPADASTTVKGITKMSVAPASATSPIAVGDNDPRVPTQNENDALAGDASPSSSNKFLTQNGYAVQQNGAQTYATTTGSANAYVLTLSPVPAALVNGMRIYFRTNFATTSAATLNLNSLGAKSLVLPDGTAIGAGDMGSGQYFMAIYDSTADKWVVFSMILKTGLLYATSAAVDITGVTTEQDLISGFTVPANLIGSGNVIEFEIRLSMTNKGAGNTFTPRLKLGSTTILTTVLTSADNSDSDIWIKGSIHGDGSSSAQEVRGSYIADSHMNATTAHINGTGAEDQTSAKTLKLTGQMNNSAAHFILRSAWFKIIK